MKAVFFAEYKKSNVIDVQSVSEEYVEKTFKVLSDQVLTHLQFLDRSCLELYSTSAISLKIESSIMDILIWWIVNSDPVSPAPLWYKLYARQFISL